MRAPGLAELRRLLLRDHDRDGFPDALVGPVWIATGRSSANTDAAAVDATVVDATVAAAAELIASLAHRALTLPVAVRSWRHERPAFRIASVAPDEDTGALDASGAARAGTRASETSDSTAPRQGHADLPSGVRVQWDEDGVTFDAPDGEALVLGVTTWLDGERASDPPAADGEDAFVPSFAFASACGAPEALAAAVRVALDATRVPRRLLTTPASAHTVVALDPDLPPGWWEIRRRTPGDRPADDTGATAHPIVGHAIVGRDAAALGRACAWFAHHHPRLPDGRWLDDVEAGLTRFVRAETRDGRLAAAASTLCRRRAEGGSAIRAELPYPAHDAALLLGVPVRNSARDGDVRRWRTEIPWEGGRLVDLARRLATDVAVRRSRARDGVDDTGRVAVTIEAFASERLAVRASLADAIRSTAEAAGLVVDDVRVRHAFRPALHWLTEEVVPALPEACATLQVHASQPAPSDEPTGVPTGTSEAAPTPPERWLRELYPVAELIEARRPDVAVELRLDEPADRPHYWALALDRDGLPLARFELAPFVAASPLPEGGSVPTATGGVRLWVDGTVVAEQRNPTDADAFWRWFAGEVLPEVTDELDHDRTPHLHELAVGVTLSEPDDRLEVDHETDSVLEALHEDVYFSVLEAFDRALGVDRARQASPGRILPFVRGADRAPMRAQAIRRRWGSERCGVVDGHGTWHPAPECDATVRVGAVVGEADDVRELRLAVSEDSASSSDAAARLAWAGRARPSVLPAGVPISVLGSVGAAPATRLDAVPLAPPVGPLPDRPLHPREVVAHARGVAGRRPEVRSDLPRESCLGQPLVVIETGRPAGPDVSLARRAAWKPSILLSARQHANEATSTLAAFDWLERLLGDDDVLRRANLIVHPLENPDGARLHAALCSLAPNHMHHAARYTAFGADLQTEPRVGGTMIGESAIRRDAARRWRPALHLNDHGYPAHAWIRSQTGFLPRGFEDWSLPVGHLSILTVHPDDADAARGLRSVLTAATESALVGDDEIRARTVAQVRRRERYRPAGEDTFTFRSGLPFWLHHRPHEKPASDGDAALTPLATLITEVPDETVDGDAWHACVRMHRLANEAVARSFLAWLRDRTPDRPPDRS